MCLSSASQPAASREGQSPSPSRRPGPAFRMNAVGGASAVRNLPTVLLFQDAPPSPHSHAGSGPSLSRADRRTGQCVCQPQYGSSDGDFNAGFLGDCAHLDALYRFPR